MDRTPHFRHGRSARTPRLRWPSSVLLALVLTALGPAGPLLSCLPPAETVSACCRGRCCCSNAKPPAAGACVRAACPCGHPAGSVPALVSIPDAVLPSAPVVVVSGRALLRPHALARPALVDDGSVPHPPPRPARLTITFA